MKNDSRETIGIIGAGAWGTALAQSMALAGRPVRLCAREPEIVASINTRHENTLFLPGIALAPDIRATLTPAECANQDVLLIATPAQHVRNTLTSLQKDIPHDRPVILCAKGIEIETGRLLSDIAAEILPMAQIGILSGPTFAREIAQGLPGAATLALHDPAQAGHLAQILGNKKFRLYPSDDVTGAEIGGAIKNVIAIASGIVAGRAMGDTARAALVTRGLAEIARLAVVLGGRRETLLGLCGMGDLLLTATSAQSRNYSLGLALGQGRNLADILSERLSVTEGIHTARAVKALATRHAIDMPICSVIYACLCENLPLDEAIDQLLNRPVRLETL
ncbi:MAG: NAD(P)-dependent glycerol-3-phosphate dehydrogenase [Rhodospirillales bacterium]|nr:NAD(P)-dependent glycerol-3-phosphate dehydrogenase [Rhodospirillales bacterium]